MIILDGLICLYFNLDFKHIIACCFGKFRLCSLSYSFHVFCVSVCVWIKVRWKEVSNLACLTAGYRFRY